jgi:hypothetical protein
MKQSARTGFTLIELSILLVVIGLIVGGVLVGQDLIRSAGIRKTISELQKFQTAIATFKGKYDCLAGDCPNATIFLGRTLRDVPLTTTTALLRERVTAMATDQSTDGRPLAMWRIFMRGKTFLLQVSHPLLP